LASPVAGVKPIGPSRPARRHTNKRPCAVRGGLLLLYTLLHKLQKTLVLWAFLGWNPITGIAGCCARAASGHAATPPSSVMNSRLLLRNTIQKSL